MPLVISEDESGNKPMPVYNAHRRVRPELGKALQTLSHPSTHDAVAADQDGYSHPPIS